MPVDKQVLLRYQVLNKCFRNRYREYTIDDLVDECNKALRRMDKPDVSKRTIQNDINILEADYGIMLDEKLKQGKKRLYRYVDTDYSIPLFRINDEERHKLHDAIRVLENFEGEPMYDWARTLLMQIEGGLFTDESTPVLLPNGTNQSYNDMKEDEKITHYVKENLLAKSLCPQAYQNNPNFTSFVSSKHLDFKSYAHFDKSAIEQRCVLYSQIAKTIWEL